jgi:putative adenylate-forming enzyme
MLSETLQIARHFSQVRWGLNFRTRSQLEDWQHNQLNRFLSDILPRASRYQGSKFETLADVPMMDKALMMANFAASNTRGISLDQALAVALPAEISRDFSPMLGDLTVGLSSGTSGNRGVFLISNAERIRWAGVLLARALPSHLLPRLLMPWQAPLRVAFFLRANSNVYTTLNSRRIDFSFYDLLQELTESLPRLNASQPDVLVAPASVLCGLAAEVQTRRLRIRPSHVIAVAEVLEMRDANFLREVFGVSPHQIYQATEGFLGYTCEAGTLHLNECCVHIEHDWLDATRFQPIITDFSRHTQLIVRYRLNDILRIAEQPCVCGRAERAITAIEGRSDEIIWLPARHINQAIAIYPDQLRRAMLLTEVREYQITQLGMLLQINLLSTGTRELATTSVSNALNILWQSMGVQVPTMQFGDWQSLEAGVKRRRVSVIHLPKGLRCAF